MPTTTRTGTITGIKKQNRKTNTINRNFPILGDISKFMTVTVLWFLKYNKSSEIIQWVILWNALRPRYMSLGRQPNKKTIKQTSSSAMG